MTIQYGEKSDEMEKIPRVLPNWEEWSPKMEIMGKEFHSGGATLSVGTLQPDRSWTPYGGGSSWLPQAQSAEQQQDKPSWKGRHH